MANKKTLELSKLIPDRLKNPTSVSVINNLFDRFLTKDTSSSILGWVGDNLPNSLFIKQPIFERRINSLEPVLYTQHGTQEFATSFKDILDKLKLLGVNTDDLNQWGKAQKFNFAPPINIDKFINFSRYRWIGNIIPHKNALAYNPTMDPEYYVIAWPVADDKRKIPVRVASTADIPQLRGLMTVDGIDLRKGDRVLVKDQSTFKNNGAYVVNSYDLLNPPRVIFSGNVNISIPGAHVASDTIAIVDPLTGLITGIKIPANAGFGYQEAPKISFIGGSAGGAMATAILGESGAITGFTITDPGAAWTRAIDFDDKNLTTDDYGVSRKEAVTGATFAVVQGTQNSGSYWQLASVNNIIDYDSLYFEKLNVVLTDWTANNFWVHENEIEEIGIDINTTSQAIRPIIEYDYNLELNSTIDSNGVPTSPDQSGLNGTVSFLQHKTQFNQKPLFNLYTLDETANTEFGQHTGLVSSVFYYAEDQKYPVDAVLKRRIAAPGTASKDYVFEQGLIGSNDQMYFFKLNGKCTSIWAPGAVEAPTWVREKADGTSIVLPAGPRGDKQTLLEVRVATPSRTNDINVNVTLSGTYILDGLTLSVGDKVLVSDQTLTAENGVYIVSANGWSKTVDFIASTSGRVIKVLEGTKANTYWALTSPNPITTYVTPITFEQINQEVEGAWIVPSQMFYNLEHENRKLTNFADLRSHFASILQEQPLLIGSAFGRNNARNIKIDMGEGGKIRDYNSAFNLFVSLINQSDISPLSVLDFGQYAYETSLNSAAEFLNINLMKLISDSKIRAIDTVNSHDRNVLKLLEYYEQNLAARTDLTKVYGDSNSAITNWPATLPYLGFNSHVPEIKFDNELGIYVIVHHDGHESPIFQIDNNIILRLVQEQIKRSDFSLTSGIISTVTPAKPYRNQLWYNTAEQQLYAFDVLSDAAVFADDIAVIAGEAAVEEYLQKNPDVSDEALINKIGLNAFRNAVITIKANLVNGDLWFNRAAGELLEWNATSLTWTPLGTSPSIIKSAFKRLDLSDLYNSFILAIEEKLYAGIPAYEESRFDLTQYAQAPEREIELASFAAKNSLDMYITDYNPNDAYRPADPFTWNYSLSTFSGIPSEILGTQPHLARWYSIYKAYFKSTMYPDGTSRPNLQPWVLTNQTEADFRAIWNSATFGSESMWDYVKTIWQKPLCVNVTTNELLPPYVSSQDPSAAEALTNTIPSNVNARYSLGDLGPVELAWERSINYQYGLARVAFRKDPINFIGKCWGSNNVKVNGYEIDKASCKKLSQKDNLLHGDIIIKPVSRKISTIFTTNPIINSDADVTWTLTCVSNLSTFSAFAVTNSLSNNTFVARSDENFSVSDTSTSIAFKLSNAGLDFENSDVITIKKNSSTNVIDISFTPALYKSYNGIAQLYSQLLRSNSQDSKTSINVSLFRDWVIQLGHRVGGMINTDGLKLKTDANVIHKSDFKHIVKNNPYFKESWLESLRIQLVQKGASIIKEDNTVPVSDASDWKFRIELYNFHKPEISYYELIESADNTNFHALSKSHTDTTWYHYKQLGVLKTISMPVVITGLQNVVNFIFGYLAKVEEDGWEFNNHNDPQVDQATGRLLGYQLEVEQFIDTVYAGMLVGQGAIINPFLNKVWVNTEFGVASEFKGNKFLDLRSAPCALDVLGNVIPLDQLRILRSDKITEIVSSVPMASVHSMIDSYEHILIFSKYSADATSRNLIYDPFLGLRTKRIYLDGKKQRVFDGKPSLEGHFLKGKGLSENIEASVSKMLNYYSTNEAAGSSNTSRAAQALLGYNKKSYFNNIDTPDISQFNFWKGLIHNKGSNLSIDAYLNSAKFKSAFIDEYWAYKLASYGDSRPKVFPEIKLDASDTRNRFTIMRFAEVGEDLEPIADGSIIITPKDEKRWFSLNEIGTSLYFEAQVLKTVTGIGLVGQIIDLPVRADDVVGATLINSTTARLDATGNYEIKCYGPAAPKFSPAKLIDYRNQVSLGDIPIWDPARGLHNSRAIEILDIISPSNPAKYNISTQITDNPNYDTLRPWGKEHVGNIWWDTTNRGYIRYSDKEAYPLMDDRLNRWGALADWASIDVYEWVSSPVPPTKWSDLVKAQANDANIPNSEKISGAPANAQLFFRDREWKQRVVAWQYSANPPLGYNFVAGSGQQKLILTGNTIGKQVAVLNVGRFSTFGIKAGMSLAAFDYVNNKPFGEGKLSGKIYFACGKEAANEWADYRLDPLNIETLSSITVSASKAIDIGKFIGPIELSNVILNNELYVKATVATSGDNQLIRIATDAKAGTNLSLDFSDLGIMLTATALSDITKADIAASFGNESHDVYVREVMALDVIVEFPTSTVDPSNLGMSRDIDDGLALGWAIWSEPTAAQLLADLPAPNNCWNPVNGDYESIAFSTSLLERINKYSAKPLMFSDGTLQDKFIFNWTEWKKLSPVKVDSKVITPLDQTTVDSWVITFSNDVAVDSLGNIDSKYLKVYVDGQIRKSNSYTISGRVVTFNFPLKVGQSLTAIIGRYAPSSEELSFNPDISDNVKTTRQYKIDHEYVVEAKRDSSGQLISTLYYFWVKDKTFVALGKKISVKAATELLTVNTDPYLVLQDYKGESIAYKEVLNNLPQGYDNQLYDIVGYDSNGIDFAPDGKVGSILTRKCLHPDYPDGFPIGYDFSRYESLPYDDTNIVTSAELVEDGVLPRRYVTASVFGLSSQVTRDDTYKLRFTKNFTLRDDPNGIDLKNVHVEWMLIRKSQAAKIPKKLWDLLTNAASGSDATGNIIPTLNRVDYDLSNNTFERFGFESDQALVDKSLAIETIKYTILNTSLRIAKPNSDNNSDLPDIITALDFSQSEEWFSNAITTRQTLTKIWNEAKPSQINEIFFAVLNDALSHNYEFTDIFKTSMLSAYSIRVLQNELN